MTDISRRDVLGGTGRLAIAAGAVGAAPGLGWLAPRPAPGGQLRPGPAQPGDQPVAAESPADRPRWRRPRPDWDRLARELRGRLLRPGDAGYTAASLPYNRRYAAIAPGGVALCADAADVATAVLWARRYEVPFAARSGGHSYGGYSASRGLVISLAPMNAFRVDRRALTVTTGAGVRLREVYAGLEGTGVAVPGGRCPTVGISGLLLGGGFGFSSRHLGLTCDQLLETEVVTASGQIVRATPAAHPDLFWACQGGGGGNFGINTRYTLRATPVGGVSVYRLEWPWRRAAAALEAMQALMSHAPAALSCRVGLDVHGGGTVTGGTPERGVSALGLYFGPSRDLAELLAPVLAAAWPSAQQVEDRGYLAAQAFLAHNVPFGRFASRSRFLPRALPAAGLDTAIRWVERWPGSSNAGGGGMTLFAWGGRINQVRSAATAFVHRDAAFLMDTETSWTERDSPRVVSAGLDWLDGIYGALRPFGTPQAYQNFIDPALADWQSAYYGANLPRLKQVKRDWDPDRVFKFPQAIPDAATPA
jgi:FAD binding domain/Berberine and berberine like